MSVSVHQYHEGPYGRTVEWEHVIDIDSWGEPCGAQLFIDGVCVDGEVAREEYMRVWAEHRRAETEWRADALAQQLEAA